MGTFGGKKRVLSRQLPKGQVFLLIILLIITVLTLGACGSAADITASLAQKANPQGAKIGDLAPDFRLPTTRGEEVSLRELRGSPVLLYFWASWCGSCTFDLSDIETVASQETGNGLVTVTVNIGEEPQFVERYVKDTVGGDYSFIVASDTSLETFRRYHILSFPTTFFIDRDGVIRSMRVGRVSERLLMEKLQNIQ